MAVLYLVIALFIIVTNISLIPDVFGQIFSNAFNFDSAAGGFLGGLISTTMMQGIKRGLYSNEAGMGSAPNAAAAAEVKHPVSQGMIQMLGVFDSSTRRPKMNSHSESTIISSTVYRS